MKYNLICHGPRYCVITEISRTPAVPTNLNGNPPAPAVEKTQITSIKNTKPYVPVVTLSINNSIKALENMSKDLKEHFLGTNIHLKKQCKQKIII